MPRYGVTWPEADAAASRVATEIEAQKLPLPPQALIDAIGGGDGSAVGRNNLRLLLSLGNLTTASRVLEPGCGFGRNARWLGPYLRTGSYDGFDIVPNLVEWGEKELTRRYPNVRRGPFPAASDRPSVGATSTARRRRRAASAAAATRF